MHPLNEKDRVRLADVEDRIQEAAKQLGYCREQYLAREALLTRTLTALRAERQQTLNVLAREYLSDEDPNEWQYNTDTKTFEKRTD